MSAPVPYPSHWEFDTVLGDGGTAHVRPILPDDAEAYLRFFHGLSRETRYYRFFSPKSELSADEVARFTTVDHADRVALIALVGDDIVAVARYDRLPDAAVGGGRLGGDAEVAFTIDDAHQGRGLGTLMLEYLAAAGREHGIERFVAETMPDNRRMIAVFHAAGYRTTDRFADGLVQVEFPIAATDAARDALQRREHTAESRSIARVLAPSSVVVIGPTGAADAAAVQVRRNLAHFVGEVRTVERGSELVGLDLSAELAVVATPPGEAIEAVAACAGHGVNAVVVLGGGVRDGAGDAAWASELLRLARHEGLRLVGPGSIGLVNTALGLHATAAPVLPSPGRIGVMVDSGPVGVELLGRLGARGLGVSTFVSAGDKADVSGNDLLQYWEDDPTTDVALLHLESLGNPRKFARIARRVGARTPIVAVWPGGVPGHDLDDRAVDALFHQAGVVRVDSIDEMVSVAARLLGDEGGDDSSGVDRVVARHRGWRRREQGSVPELDGIEPDAAGTVVGAALAGADEIVASPGTLAALLAAYGVTLAHGSPEPEPEGESAREMNSISLAVAIVQDPTFGSLVTVGGVPGRRFAPVDLRLVPLTDRDAAELATAAVPEPPSSFADLLVRLGLLADDWAEVGELVLDPVRVGPGGVSILGGSLRLHRVSSRSPDLIRRLRT